MSSENMTPLYFSVYKLEVDTELNSQLQKSTRRWNKGLNIGLYSVLEDYKGVAEVVIQLLYTVVIFLLHSFCEMLILLLAHKVRDYSQESFSVGAVVSLT